jgi:hypothetical protein
MSARPVSSLTGLARSRQNFSPLYCLELWLGRDHHPRKIQRTRREVHEVRGGETDIHDVDAARGDALRDRGGELG